jgi:hypothetical protein
MGRPAFLVPVEWRAMKQRIWVTMNGLPLTIALQWPFHQSTSGADFWVLHGDIRLENGEGRHAAVSVNLSQTVREVMASLEEKDAEGPVINALRKEVDRRQIEFAKSGKLLPVPFSSRHYDFKRKKWVFGKASEDAIVTFLERKVYWGMKLYPLLAKEARSGAPHVENGSEEKQVPHGGFAPVRNDIPANDSAGNGVWIGDPTEAQYLETTTEHLVEVAGRIAGEGLITMENEWAEATPKLMERAGEFEGAMRRATEELEKKHTFERG